jgi:hypothetical protein
MTHTWIARSVIAGVLLAFVGASPARADMAPDGPHRERHRTNDSASPSRTIPEVLGRREPSRAPDAPVTVSPPSLEDQGLVVGATSVVSLAVGAALLLAARRSRRT